MADAKNAEKAPETVKLVANARIALPTGEVVEPGGAFSADEATAASLVKITAAKKA